MIRSDHFDAVLFDLDGTLVDTEAQTAQSIELVLKRYGIENGELPTRLTSGQSWQSICRSLCEKYPETCRQESLERELIEAWNELVNGAAKPIPGAVQAIISAQNYLSIGVVSSSPHFLVDLLLEKLGVARLIRKDVRIGGDDVEHPKPSPEGFLLCAERLEVSPERCLVFEDSVAGVEAAKRAGMTCVVILESCNDKDECCFLADHSIQNFTYLPDSFWRRIARGVEEAQTA